MKISSSQDNNELPDGLTKVFFEDDYFIVVDNLHYDKDGLLSNYDETIKCRCVKLSDKKNQEYLEDIKKQIRDHNNCI